LAGGCDETRVDLQKSSPNVWLLLIGTRDGWRRKQPEQKRGQTVKRKRLFSLGRRQEEQDTVTALRTKPIGSHFHL
jgi:hypothetical protein